MIVVAIANQKGGVGKTTTAINTATAMAASGWRTLLVDLDPQAHVTASLGTEWPEGNGTRQALGEQIFALFCFLLLSSKRVTTATRNILPSNKCLGGMCRILGRSKVG